MSALGQMKGAFGGEYAIGALYLLMLGLILSDIIPTPADAGYFYLERKNKKEWAEGTITSKQYWVRDAIFYYGLNPLWWIAVFFAVAMLGKSLKDKIYIASGIIGAGIVITVILKNIQKDELTQQKLIELQNLKTNT